MKKGQEPSSRGPLDPHRVGPFCHIGVRVNAEPMRLTKSKTPPTSTCSRVPGANRMRLLAAIEDPRVVEQILTHLGLPSEPVRADPAQPPPASAADLFAETRA